MCVCHRSSCYLAVHNKIANAASEVFVLKLRVDVRDVLVHTTQLEHMAHVQVSTMQNQTHKYAHARARTHTLIAIVRNKNSFTNSGKIFKTQIISYLFIFCSIYQDCCCCCCCCYGHLPASVGCNTCYFAG